MTETIQRNFQSETLVVDWISFKFQQFEPFRQTKVATYLFKLGFNS
jgi:c-di-GMP-binding flagellar brake protein YcgR